MKSKTFLQIDVERLLDETWAQLIADLKQIPSFRKSKNKSRGVEHCVVEITRDDLPWLLTFYKKWGWLENGRISVVFQGRIAPLGRIMRLCFKDQISSGGISVSMSAADVMPFIDLENKDNPGADTLQ